MAPAFSSLAGRASCSLFPRTSSRLSLYSQCASVPNGGAQSASRRTYKLVPCRHCKAAPPARRKAQAAMASETVSVAPKSEIQLQSLEPYFYYMGRRRGVKAYAIEFKEPVLSDEESQGGTREGLRCPSVILPSMVPPSQLPEAQMLKGVGVYAATDIDTTSGPKIILEIPLPLMLTVTRDLPWMFHPDVVPIGHPIFDAIQNTHPEADWDLRLACLLLLAMHGSGSGSEQHFMEEYCDFLPPLDDCASLLLATEEDLMELQDEALVELVRQRRQRVHHFWQQHWGQGANPDRVLPHTVPSERHLLWAVSQAAERGVLHHAPMGIVDQDAHMVIPYADMLNHSFAPNCSLCWRQMDRVMEVRVNAGLRIQAGEELTLSYCTRTPNQQLMLSHAFSLASNPWETLTFSGVAQIHRDSFLSAFDLVGSDGDLSFFTGVAPLDPFLDDGVIAAARCLPMWGKGDYPALPSEEITAAKELQRECIGKLDEYETSIEEDYALLGSSSDKTATFRLALNYRVNKKQFLVKIVQCLELYMDRLII